MRHKLLECSRWLDVPVPPPIDAPSVRSAWFAEEVRFSIISSRMSAAIDTYQEAFDRSTASRLLIDALSQRWPDESWVDYDDPKSGSPAGRELLSELPDLLKPQPWRVTQYGPQGSLAIWLFGREAWPSSGHPAFTEVNYQRWIAMRRTKRLHADMALHATTPGGLSLSGNVLACQIVTGLNHWESPADAWTAYVALQSGSVSDILSGAIGSHSGLSLTEMLHMGSVMSAVSEMGSVSPQMRYGQYPL